MATMDGGPGVDSSRVFGALGVVGVALGALALRRSRTRSQPLEDHGRSALTDYLRDHLTGADTAIQVVSHLTDSLAPSRGGALFASLHEQFQEERSVVAALLMDLGASPRSIRRLAAQTAGHAVRAVTSGDPGDLGLFRTLEALAIGVQGKRCLWRAAQTLVPPLRDPVRRSFVDLEKAAVDQWEAIERYRQSLAPRVFASDRLV